MRNRIMLVGPSGIGKTTIAKVISQKFKITFISGSISDLIPNTKDKTHEQLMLKCNHDLAFKNWQVLNARNKVFRDRLEFITDRSYVDAAAYYWYELSTRYPECEMEHFFGTAQKLMEDHCDLAIFLPLNLHDLSEWTLEDNGKRVMNRYFQAQISMLMETLLSYFETPTLVVDSLDYDERISIIENFLEGWLRRK